MQDCLTHKCHVRTPDYSIDPDFTFIHFFILTSHNTQHFSGAKANRQPNQPSPTLTPTFDPSVVRNHIFPWIPPKRKPIFGSSDDSHTQEQYDLRRTVEDLERNEWEKKVFRARLFPWATAPPLPSLLLNKHRTGTPSQTSRFYHEHWLYATGKIISRPRYPAHLRLDYSTPWSSDYANLDEMAARLLTQSNSKLSNRNIIVIITLAPNLSTNADTPIRQSCPTKNPGAL